MRALAFCFSLLPLLITFPVLAHDEDKPVNTAAQLSPWCKHLVEQNYLAQNQFPRNWREDTVVNGDYMTTRLVYRIDYEDYQAQCTIRTGAARSDVVLTLLGKR
jgi:hypothetical protein